MESVSHRKSLIITGVASTFVLILFLTVYLRQPAEREWQFPPLYPEDDDAEQLYHQAIKDKNFERALEVCDKRIKKYADHAEAYIWKIDTLRKLQRYDEVDATVSILPDHPKDLVYSEELSIKWMLNRESKGKAFLSLEKYEEAVSWYNQHLYTGSDFYGKATALCELGRYAEALSTCDEGLAKFHNDTFLLFQKAYVLLSMGRPENALEIAILNIPKNEEAPNNRSLELLVGVALHYLARYEEAIVHYDKILSITPDSVPELKRKAESLKEIAKYQDAINIYDKIAEINPDLFTYCLQEKIEILHLLQQYEEELNLKNKMITLHGNTTQSQFLAKCCVYPLMNKHIDAISNCTSAITHNNASINTQWEAHICKGFALKKMGQINESIYHMEQSEKLASNIPHYFLSKANLLRFLLEFDAALDSCDKSIQLNEDDTTTLYLKALILMDQGKYQDAYMIANAILLEKPGLLEVHRILNHITRFNLMKTP